MLSDIDVSIIVPVYNTEKFLFRCLDSLVTQTLTNIEIICVDDGSTDKSLEILNHFAQKDKRIKVITQKNQKQGTARNNGLKIATGKYIGFVDSDDYIDPDFYKKMFDSAITNNADIACSSIVRTRKHSKKYRILYNDVNYFTTLEDKLEACTSANGDYTWNVWNKIYRRNFLVGNNILFDENVYYEDVNFSIKALHLSNLIVTVPNTYYYYCARNNSIVKSIQNRKKRIDLKNAYSKFWAYCDKNKIKISSKNLYCLQVYLRFFNIILFSTKSKFKDGQIIDSYKIFNIFKVYEKNKQNPYICDDYPVDMVYLWCDGNDKSFIQEKTKWQQKLGIENNERNFNCQWIDHDELKYSLRSLKKYAPWIRNIYIVTNSQPPSWLKSSQNIKIVDVKDIMPTDSLPTFNSQAMETCIHKIEGLSEHFLYSNDDMFFNNPVDKSFFFDEYGKPIARMQPQISKKTLKRSQYARTIISAQNKVKEISNIKIEYAPHHCIDAYTKTIFNDCINDFKEDFERTCYQKFRSEDSIQRAIILYKALANNQAVLRLTKPYNLFTRDSKCIALNNPKKLRYLNNKSIKLFCINDDSKATDKDRAIIKNYLQNRFPDKCIFEE